MKLPSCLSGMSGERMTSPVVNEPVLKLEMCYHNHFETIAEVVESQSYHIKQEMFDEGSGKIPEVVMFDEESGNIPEVVIFDEESGKIPEVEMFDEESGKIPEVVMFDEVSGKIPEVVMFDVESGKIPEVVKLETDIKQEVLKEEPVVEEEILCSDKDDTSLKVENRSSYSVADMILMENTTEVAVVESVLHTLRPDRCTNYGGLDEHMQQSHPRQVHSEEKPFNCTKCSYKCKNKSSLAQHLRHVHSNEKPYSCTECSYKCKSKCNLKTHMKHFHCKDKPYKYKKKTTLLGHLNEFHSDEKPLNSCTECPYKYNLSKWNLQQRYKIVHTSEERPFSCLKCLCKFKWKGELLKHSRATHSDERPFSCIKCPYKFKRNADLLRHSRAIHGADERPFSCING